MATRILVLATDGESREDGMVHYSSYVLVSSDTLNFDEPVFSEHITRDILGLGEQEEDDYIEKEQVITHIQALGYTVEKPGVKILWVPG
jgi:hypothetical protein